jgi:uncharacterized protein (TIGR00269 family)
MECIKCKKKAVYGGKGQNLCKSHFLEYFESKVFRTIKEYALIEKNDKVCVAASGGKDSINVLYLSSLFCRKNNIEFFALAIDEGINGYRSKTLKDLKAFCKKQKIVLYVESFKKNFGKTLDSVKNDAMKRLGKKPCTVCGILRRTLLNRAARKYNATKLITGHNLDDESQSFLMNLLLGNMSRNAALGPITGLNTNEKFVARVKPLYFITEKESRLYSILKGFKTEFCECPNIGLSFRMTIRDELNAIEDKLPGAKNGMVNSFLEILPILKNYYSKEKSAKILAGKKAKENTNNKQDAKNFNYCSGCGDACSGNICNACLLLEELF